LTGPLSNTMLRSTNAVTSAESNLYIPITESSATTDAGFIIFADSVGQLPDLNRLTRRDNLLGERPAGERPFLEGLEMEWDGPPDEIGWFGGPVQPQMGTALFDHSGLELAGQIMPVRPPTHLTADLEVIRQLAGTPPDRFRLILGYSGWGAGQLDEEMNRNDWLVAPFDSDILFNRDPETTWVHALASIDVKPESLAAWTPSDPRSSN
ncbi:MAG: YqgE/AlgH family protein, partial [Acidobacteria bacterium]|nr:YqgE/AlgH family protein [Acidobacteriota bacterium]